MNENTGGYNKTGILLALLAITELSLRPAAKVPVPVQKGSVSKSWVNSGLALGSLIFALHNLLADSTTLIAWSWTGYPVQGPVPHLHGYLTITAQSIGLAIPALLPSDLVSIVCHPLWFAYGAVSAYVMYRYRDWVGYFGGLNLAVFCMSVLPMVLSMDCGIIQWSFGEDVYPSVLCYLSPLLCECVDGRVCVCSRRRLPS
jgi:hypothetical protein